MDPSSPDDIVPSLEQTKSKPQAPKRRSGRFSEREKGAEGWVPSNVLGVRAWLSIGVVALILWNVFGRDRTPPTLQVLGANSTPAGLVVRLRALDADSDWVDVSHNGITKRAPRNKEILFVVQPGELVFEVRDSGGNLRLVRVDLSMPASPLETPRSR